MPDIQRRSSNSRTNLRAEIAEHDDADEEDAPDELRDLVGAAALRVVGDVVGLEIQRADDADDDGEDAADQHVEEVVDARAAAAQPVEALQVEAERHDHGHERQHVEVLRERRLALGDREEAGVEADEVGQHEGHRANRGVGQHVQGDEQAVVAPYHRSSRGGREHLVDARR